MGGSGHAENILCKLIFLVLSAYISVCPAQSSLFVSHALAVVIKHSHFCTCTCYGIFDVTLNA